MDYPTDYQGETRKVASDRHLDQHFHQYSLEGIEKWTNCMETLEEIL